MHYTEIDKKWGSFGNQVMFQ